MPSQAHRRSIHAARPALPALPARSLVWTYNLSPKGLYRLPADDQCHARRLPGPGLCALHPPAGLLRGHGALQASSAGWQGWVGVGGGSGVGWVAWGGLGWVGVGGGPGRLLISCLCAPGVPACPRRDTGTLPTSRWVLSCLLHETAGPCGSAACWAWPAPWSLPLTRARTRRTSLCLAGAGWRCQVAQQAQRGGRTQRRRRRPWATPSSLLLPLATLPLPSGSRRGRCGTECRPCCSRWASLSSWLLPPWPHSRWLQRELPERAGRWRRCGPAGGSRRPGDSSCGRLWGPAPSPPSCT